MATDVRPIQIRRGNEADYDKSKMLPGEFAVSLDQKKLRIAFAPGDDKQVAFSSEVQEVQNNLDYEVSQLEENLAAADDDITAIQGNVSRINTILNGKVDEAYLSEDHKYLILKANGDLVAELGPFAGEGGGGGDGKVKDVQFNGRSFLNDVTGIANFPSDEIGVENGKLKILKIKNEQITIQ